MVDYIEALKQINESRNKVFKTYLFSLPIPLLNLFTNPIAAYYIVKCGAHRAEKGKNLPEWEPLWNMWIKFLALIIIAIVYIIPMIILGIIIAILLAIPTWIGLGDYVWSASIGVNTFMIVIAVYAYILPIASIKYCKDDMISSAFNYRDIFRLALNRNYILAGIIFAIIYIGIFSLQKQIPVNSPTLIEFGKKIMQHSLAFVDITQISLSVIKIAIFSFINLIVTLTAYIITGQIMSEDISSDSKKANKPKNKKPESPKKDIKWFSLED